MKTLVVIVALLPITLLCAFSLGYIQKISTDVETSNVYKGKVIHTKGTFFYDFKLSKSVTHLSYPREMYKIIEGNGKSISYDVQSNMAQSTSSDFLGANQNVFVYFLSPDTKDLGLRERGFTLKDTKVVNKLLVKTYTPPTTLINTLSKTELVLQNNIAIYMSNYDLSGRISNKTFFSKFINIQNAQVPTLIADIQYVYDKKSKDSIITRSTFSNHRTNGDIDTKYLDFKLPSNAKITFN